MYLYNGCGCDVHMCVIGSFEDEEVTHVDGDINPVRDLETIHDELRLKDIQYCNNRLVKP